MCQRPGGPASPVVPASHQFPGLSLCTQKGKGLAEWNRGSETPGLNHRDQRVTVARHPGLISRAPCRGGLRTACGGWGCLEAQYCVSVRECACMRVGG